MPKENDNHQSTHRRLAFMRCLVGFLGERDQANWWNTGFLSPTGLRYSEINFPRSAVSASSVSVTEAARKLHDSRIGKGGVFHLFRLPPVIEEAVHREMLFGDSATVRSSIRDKDVAFANLEQFAEKKISGQEGPVQIGSVKTILHSSTISATAAHYLDAFRNNRKTFPYFIDR